MLPRGHATLPPWGADAGTFSTTSIADLRRKAAQGGNGSSKVFSAGYALLSPWHARAAKLLYYLRRHYLVLCE
ncbi:MAG: hypothetical protein JWO80_1627 [Bryobacterales bacterium]|nr:hypothetical protein [Bryobacterales bacterium]